MRPFAERLSVVAPSITLAMNARAADLKAKGVQPLDFFQQPIDQPTVFAWMPAAAVYFHDPDGHLLEYIAPMEGPPQPERGLMTLEEWKENA